MKNLFDRISILCPGSSKTSMRTWLKEGRVEVDGLIVSDGERLIPDEAKLRLLPKKSKEPEYYKTFYSDPHLIVVEKPAGLLTVTTDSGKEESLHGYLKQKHEKVWPVHRLDRETSGVLVFALAEEAKEGLKEQFATHSIKRLYHALVEGSPKEECGTVRSFLWEDSSYIVHSSKEPNGGKEAITHFRVLKRFTHHTLLELELETGRKNQIRVQMQEIGHPVAGDKKYGALTNPIGRVALHAAYLSFLHPVKKEQLSFEAPTPQSFNLILPRSAWM